MPKNPERTRALRQYVQEQVEKFRAGEVAELPSNHDFMRRFDYSTHSSMYDTLKGTELLQERQRVREMRLSRIIEPSLELGWILGSLSGSGSVDRKLGTVRLFGEEPLLVEFRRIGEVIFRENISQKLVVHKGQEDTLAAHFSSIHIARQLGDLRFHNWPQTIHSSSRHKSGVAGVVVQNIDDIRIFARSIHSRIPEKEQKLELYRNIYLKKGGHPEIYPDNELIAEYREIVELLGHTPTTTEFRELKRRNLVTYSPTTLARRFGNGSFSAARAALDRITGQGQ